MKRIISATLLSAALFTAPAVHAQSYQNRAMLTGAAVGATTGAVVGSSRNQAVEGAIFGAFFGTIAGALIASQNQPTYVVQQRSRPHYKPVAYRYQRRVHHAHRYHRQHDRGIVSRSYAHERSYRHD